VKNKDVASFAVGHTQHETSRSEKPFYGVAIGDSTATNNKTAIRVDELQLGRTQETR
jgi:hypothetical protein